MICPTFGRNLLMAALLAGSATVVAQGNAIKNFRSGDPALRKQADSLRNRYADNGYTLVEGIPVTMKSDSQLPVIVNLTRGDWYQVIFIGDKRSRASEISLFDFDEHKVAYKRNLISQDGNVISCSYVPQGSEYHLIRTMQSTKHPGRTLHGWFMLLQRAGRPTTRDPHRP